MNSDNLPDNSPTPANQPASQPVNPPEADRVPVSSYTPVPHAPASQPWVGQVSNSPASQPVSPPVNQPLAGSAGQIPTVTPQAAPLSVAPTPVRSFEQTTVRPEMPVRPAPDPAAAQMAEIKRQKFIKKAQQIIFYFLTVLEILFALRLVFKLLTANSASSLVLWIFDISDVFLNPFVGIVKNSGKGAHVLEWTTLIAMGLYALLALIMTGLAKLFAPTAPQKVWEE